MMSLLVGEMCVTDVSGFGIGLATTEAGNREAGSFLQVVIPGVGGKGSVPTAASLSAESKSKLASTVFKQVVSASKPAKKKKRSSQSSAFNA